MKEKVNKVIAILLIFSLVGMSFVSDAVYASNLIAENSDDLQENKAEVMFAASINDTNLVVADISEELKMHLKIYVQNAGYLKDVNVSLNNNNYEIAKTAEEINEGIIAENSNISKDKLIRAINGNEIILNEIDAGDTLELDIPIKYSKKEEVSAEYFNKESQVILKGIFVNSRNQEKEIMQMETERVQWTIKAESRIKQELLRYLKYNGKTMVSFEITDEIKENKIPASKKEINISVPKIEGELPEYAVATGEEIEQNYNNGMLTITKTKKANEAGKYRYETEDKYTVTYIYNKQTDSAKIETIATDKITTIADTELQSTSETNSFEVNAEVGSIVGMQVALPGEINKGYMYTNLNRGENKLDTNYNSIYRINIGYAELTDKIIVTEDSTTLNDENNILADINSEIKARKVVVSREEILSTLGEEGQIIVRNENSEELGKLNKDVQELNIEANKLSFETSNPIKEGDININLEKQILGSVNFTREGLELIKKLSSKVTVAGYNEENEISKSTIVGEINLSNPTSKGSVETNIDTLSTVTLNENVVFNIVLNRTDISDALYTNPAVRINLPSQVSTVSVTSAKVVYDEELNAGDISVNGNEIIIQLQGTQTQYNTLETTQGTLIRVVANIGLNYLLPSSKENVKVELYNEATGELNSVEKEIKIVAPNDFIRTHEMTIGEESRQAIDNEVETIKVKTGEEAKAMQVSAQIINNLGRTAEGFSILGRLPFEGNKTIGGKELETNVNASLASAIEVEGLENATVYYSNNGEEPVDSINWTTEAIGDAKTFKIESTTGLNDKQLMKFKYNVTIPENLDYEKVGKFNYGIYYNNDAQNGVSKNLVEAKVLGFETGIAPALRIGVTASDTNEGYNIPEGGEVREGQYITYRIKVVNTGTETINQATIVASLPEGVTLIMPEQSSENDNIERYKESSSKVLLQEISLLDGGMDVIYEFTVKISDKLSDDKKNTGKDLPVEFSLVADILGENAIQTTYTVKNTSGYFGIKLSSDAVSPVDGNEEINYFISLKNANYDDKTNTNIKLKLPENIIYTGIDSKYENAVNYNENENTLTINMGTFKGNDEEEIKVRTLNINDKTQELTTQAEVMCDGLEGSIKSNIVEFTTEISSKVIQAVQTSTSSNITDKEEVEFFTDITNTGDIGRVIQYNNEVDNSLEVIEYKVTIDGETLDEGKTNNIEKTILIPTGSTARISVRAEPYPIEGGLLVGIVNQPIILTGDGAEMHVNGVKLNIASTSLAETNEVVEQGKVENSAIPEPEKTLTISGTIWLDEYEDGVRGAFEDVFTNMNIKLYNVDSKEMLKDENGEDIVAITNEFGEYKFYNIKPGNYVVIVQYDDLIYEIGEYKAKGIDESLNSDFVTATLDNKSVAATDVLTLLDSNLSNVDLGLVEKEQFNLSINQTVNKITVSSNGNTRELGFDDSTANLELSEKELQNSTMLVEYNVRISNNGNVAGYAKQIMNSLPKGMAFNSQLNPDWYLGKDGNLYSVYLGDEIIEPGESKDIKLILIKEVTNGQTGIIRGRTELDKTYNEKGLEPISALSEKYSNVSGTNLILLKQSKVKALVVVGISIGILALVGVATFEIKKHFIDKMYDYEDLDFLNK